MYVKRYECHEQNRSALFIAIGAFGSEGLDDIRDLLGALIRPIEAIVMARRTLAGYEALTMIRKGQVRNINGSHIRAQAGFIAGLFDVAA